MNNLTRAEAGVAVVTAAAAAAVWAAAKATVIDPELVGLALRAVANPLNARPQPPHHRVQTSPDRGKRTALGKGQAMTMEYVGTVEVTPPMRARDQDWVRGSGWLPSHDGQTIRPGAGIGLGDCVGSLRDLVTLDKGRRSYAGVVAGYDSDTRELVTITVREGRVTRRYLRRRQVQPQSNVIDLATHRRSFSRRIS
jgi:hypothetical protein